MYGQGSIGGGVVASTAGIAVLPNTGNNTLLFALAAASIAIGALIILSTVIRMIAKKIYNS